MASEDNRNWSEWAVMHGGAQALVDTIHDLKRQLDSALLQRDMNFELFRKTVDPKHTEWRVIVKRGGKWFVSPLVFPGMDRDAAIEIAEYDKKRYEDARPQIRLCSDWTDVDCMKDDEVDDEQK